MSRAARRRDYGPVCKALHRPRDVMARTAEDARGGTGPWRISREDATTFWRRLNREMGEAATRNVSTSPPPAPAMHPDGSTCGPTCACYRRSETITAPIGDPLAWAVEPEPPVNAEEVRAVGPREWRLANGSTVTFDDMERSLESPAERAQRDAVDALRYSLAVPDPAADRPPTATAITQGIQADAEAARYAREARARYVESQRAAYLGVPGPELPPPAPDSDPLRRRIRWREYGRWEAIRFMTSNAPPRPQQFDLPFPTESERILARMRDPALAWQRDARQIWWCNQPPCGHHDECGGSMTMVERRRRGEHLESVHGLCRHCEQPLTDGRCEVCPSRETMEGTSE